MKQLFKNMKLQTKLVTAFTLVIVVLATQGIGFIISLSKVNDQVDTVVHTIQPALKTVRYASSLATHASSDMDVYLESKDESQKKAYQDSVMNLDTQIDEMLNSELINKLENSGDNIHKLVEEIDLLTSLDGDVNKLNTNESEKLDTTSYATDYLNPIVKEIAQLLNEAVHSEAEDDDEGGIEVRKAILADFNEIRYSWSNVVNEMRLFLAFGSPAAKENILIYVEKIDLLIKHIAKNEDSLSFEQSNAIEEINEKLGTYKQNFNQLLTMFDGKKWLADTEFVNIKIKPIIESMSIKIGAIKVQLEAKSKAATVSVNEMYKTQSNIITISSIIIFLVICALCYLLVRNITHPIAIAVKFANKISEGDLSGHIESESTDETGQLLLALQTMKCSLKKQIESEHLLVTNSNRLKQALNTATVKVMIVDLDNNISFVSNSLNRLFIRNKTAFQAKITDFDTDKLVGSEITSILIDSELKEKLNNIKQNYTKVYKICGLTLKLTFTPIVDAESNHTGTVVEWYDRTQEVEIENEIQTIVNASLKGDLSQRISMTDKSDFFERLSKGVNEMVNVSEHIINDTADVLSHMSHGDLSKNIKGDYEGSFGRLKDDVNGTIHKLTTVMSEINSNANTVLNGAHEIFQGNTNLLKRTEAQASSLEETASSMEEMTATVQQNASNAQEANTLALGASEIATKGGHVVKEAVNAMSGITDSSKKIADIISVIDDIAFQTNLLALNAAVEAARAGEQGRGFAVVASEVRNLAGRSASAAKEIKGLIGESVSKVKEGSELVDKSGQTLEEIMAAVTKVSDIIAEIATAGEEQATGIEQVNNAINQMDQITQQNASLVEEAAVSSEAMGEQARNLNQLVGFFTLDENIVSDQSERRSSSRPWNGDNNTQKTSLGNSSATLDFATARINHLTWKKHLRSFLNGEGCDDTNLEISHHDCALGKWLYSTGLYDYEHLIEMKTLEKIHAELHSTSKEVVKLKLDGNDEGAEKKFDTMDSISEKIVILLNKIEAQLNSEDKNKEKQSSEADAIDMKKTGTDEWNKF